MGGGMKLRFLVVMALFTASGCVRTHYVTQTTVYANQSSGLWREANYRYVSTGLTGSASAEAGSHESKSLGRAAMDRLVAAARLGPNQTLVDVTIEEGWVLKSLTNYKLVTIRGDVIEFVGVAK